MRACSENKLKSSKWYQMVSILVVLAHILNRTLILVSAPNEVVACSESDDHAVHQTSPVHVDWCRVGHCWEEQEHVCHHQEAAGNDVHGKSPFAEVPLRRWESLTTKSLRDNSANDCQVTCEESGGRDRGDDVESGSGSDDDQCNQAGEDQRDVNGVCRNTAVRTHAGQEFVAWQSLVASERPHLTGAGGDLVDGAEEVHEHHDQDQNDGSSPRSSDLVNHLSPWLASAKRIQLVQVADVEHECDDSDQTQTVVDAGRGEDCSWQDVARVFELLSQMNSTVGSKICCGWSNHSDQCRKSKVAPTIAVLEAGEDNVGGLSGTEHPHNHDEGEEPKDVDNNGEALEDGEFSNSEGIEGDSGEHVSHCQECAVPWRMR